jgi:2-oxoglutarate ferredoxin oxidoreductase subunit gamma
MALYQDVTMAGFGGQGVLLIGNLLAYAGMESGFNVTFIPVYGPEMRGGTANCTVVVSSDEIGSPIIKRPQGVIILNQPSLEKFQPRVEDGGVQIVNSSLVDRALVDTKRIKSVCIPANEIADGLGNGRMLNMVALGAFIKATGVLPLAQVKASLSHVIAAHYGHLIPKNAEALQVGYEYA